MARRRKKTPWLFIIIIAVAVTSLLGTINITKPNEDTETPQEPALILTYENGADFRDFTFNK